MYLLGYWVEIQYEEFCLYKKMFFLEGSNGIEGWSVFGNIKMENLGDRLF